MVFFSSAYSQTNIKMPINIGITGGLGLNMHNPDWTDHGPLTGRPLRYNQTSTAIGYYGGIIANFPINDIFTISARIGYNNLNGTIKATATNGNITESTTIDTRLEYFEVSPILELHNLLPVKNIYFLVGLELATPFTAEGDLTYTENSTPSTWSRMNTPMEDKVPRVALAVGAGYVIPLSKNVFLTPEASFRFGITNISSESSWTVNQLRLGVSLTFGLST